MEHVVQTRADVSSVNPPSKRMVRAVFHGTRRRSPPSFPNHFTPKSQQFKFPLQPDQKYRTLHSMTWWPSGQGWWTWIRNEALSQEVVGSIPPTGRSSKVFHPRRKLQGFFPSKPVYFLQGFQQFPRSVPRRLTL